MLRAFNSRTLGRRALLFPRDSLAWHAMLGSTGHERQTTPDYDWHGLRRGDDAFALFQYTLRGAGRLAVGGREQEVLPGQAMLLHFPADNRYWLPAGGSWEFIYICVHGREILRLWREIEARLGPLHTLAPDSPPVACAARIVAAVRRGECVSAAVASALAYELAALLVAERPATPAAIRPHLAALKRAREFARANLDRPLGVADLADHARLSRFHFSRLFAAETGQSPAAWLTTQRVQAAAQYVRNTDLPLKEIALRCGFPDVHTFGKIFRRHTGQPPGHYRRSGG